MFRNETGKHKILIGSYKSSWTTLRPQTICCNETAQHLEVIKSEKWKYLSRSPHKDPFMLTLRCFIVLCFTRNLNKWHLETLVRNLNSSGNCGIAGKEGLCHFCWVMKRLITYILYLIESIEYLHTKTLEILHNINFSSFKQPLGINRHG